MKKGSIMIEKRCKIPLNDIALVEFTCHQCNNTISYTKFHKEWGCKICGNRFSNRELEILEVVSAVTRIKDENPNFTLSFVSIEHD